MLAQSHQAGVLVHVKTLSYATRRRVHVPEALRLRSSHSCTPAHRTDTNPVPDASCWDDSLEGRYAARFVVLLQQTLPHLLDLQCTSQPPAQLPCVSSMPKAAIAQTADETSPSRLRRAGLIKSCKTLQECC